MTPTRRPEALLRSLAGRTAVLLSTVALHLGRWATARNRADTLTPTDAPVVSISPPGHRPPCTSPTHTHRGA